MAGDIGLERKLVQHRLAEGMDGLDLQPARRFQRRGEKPAGARQACRARPAPVDRGEPAGERRVVEQRPVRQIRKHPVGHVGGGRAWCRSGRGFRRVGVPASNSRMTRWASTWVLPEPALADTQAELPGSEARAWGSAVSAGRGAVGFIRRPPCRLVVGAGRPFEHAGEMVVVAIHVALAERQRARQIAVGGAVIVAEQLFEPRPRFVGRGRPPSWLREPYFRIDSSLDIALHAQAHEGQIVRLRACRVPRTRRARAGSLRAPAAATPAYAPDALDGDEPVL